MADPRFRPHLFHGINVNACLVIADPHLDMRLHQGRNPFAMEMLRTRAGRADIAAARNILIQTVPDAPPDEGDE